MFSSWYRIRYKFFQAVKQIKHGSSGLLHSKANLCCGEGKYSIYFRAQQGVRAAHAWKTQPPVTFREGLSFKGNSWDKGYRGMTLSWLVDSEVIGWYLRNLIPTNLGSMCLWSAWGHHPPPGWSILAPAEQLKDTCQTVIHIPWGWTKMLNYYFLDCFTLFLHSLTSAYSAPAPWPM